MRGGAMNIVIIRKNNKRGRSRKKENERDENREIAMGERGAG